MNFTWPEVKFARINSLDEQLNHVISEIDEVFLVSPVVSPSDPDADDLLEELADLSHSLETFWRILIRERGEAFVLRLFRSGEAKNAARGYYKVGDK